jgi:hypothetical protein
MKGYTRCSVYAVGNLGHMPMEANLFRGVTYHKTFLKSTFLSFGLLLE